MFKALFAQYDYSYDAPLSSTGTASESAVSGAAIVIMLVLFLLIMIPAIAGMWKVFAKAGKPGWAAIIPFYNWWVWIEIVGRPQSWFWILLALSLLSWIPLLGLMASVAAFVLTIVLSIDLAKSFGKDVGMGILVALLPFIGLPILGFGAAKYVGPSVKATTIADPPYPTNNAAASKPVTPATTQEDNKGDDVQPRQ